MLRAGLLKKRKPFYRQSSGNRKGNLPDREVLRRRDKALTLWAQHRTAEQIAVELDVSKDAVRGYIAWGRRRQDPRAVRTRNPIPSLQAAGRRQQIAELFAKKLLTSEIATLLGVHIRSVQKCRQEMRRKEKVQE
jgi:DNA-binding CsgD family transcriptional regulator